MSAAMCVAYVPRVGDNYAATTLNVNTVRAVGSGNVMNVKTLR